MQCTLGEQASYMHAVNTTQQESWVLKAPLLHVYELHLYKGHVPSPEPIQ